MIPHNKYIVQVYEVLHKSRASGSAIGTKRTLTYFVVHLVKEGLSFGTLQRERRTHFRHAWRGYSIMLQGVKREEASRGYSPRARLPITPAILKKLKAVWQ